MTEIRFTSDITVRAVQSVGGDHMVVAAARVSVSGEEALKYADPAQAEGNAGLINYLMKMRHGTPFEHSCLTFFVHAPIFVFREWHRHRIGHCLAGDTEVWTETVAPNCGRTLRKRPIAELWRNWHEGVPDSMGRVRLLPSCRRLTVRTLNEETGVFGLSRVADVLQSGVKPLLALRTPRRTVRCSRDHRILAERGWLTAGELCAGDRVAVSGRRYIRQETSTQVPPALRRGIGVWTSMQRKTLIALVDSCYVCGHSFCRDDLELDHVIPVAADLLRALDPASLKPICPACVREKNAQDQKYRVNPRMTAGREWETLVADPTPYGEAMTYDLAVEGPWHNFVANGVVVHNSYNEESARYKQLDPVFWVPRRERKMTPAPDHKPARPKFLPLEDDRVFEMAVEDMKVAYRQAYVTYEANMARGLAKEVARAVLPVGIYSSCWVTVNPRSLMAFLSLRTHEPGARHVSYPQAEIEEAARACEDAFRQGWPVTWKAWNDCGRVAP